MHWKNIVFLAVLIFGCVGTASGVETEQWDIFELSLKGPEGGNPFIDVKLSAEFRQRGRAFEPEGFYDGNGTYRIRFMPDSPGKWTYVTKSNRRELDGKKGQC
jgi:hypothetical protein